MAYEVSQRSLIPKMVNNRAPAQGIIFDGNQGASFSISAPFGTNDFTFSIIINSFSITPSVYTWMFGGTSGALAIAINTTGVRFKKVGGAEAGTANYNFLQNESYHITVTRSNFVRKTYVNGILIDTVFDSNSYDGTNNCLNGYTSSTDQSTACTIRSPLIYNRALSESEAESLYEEGVPRKGDYNNARNSAVPSTTFLMDFSGAGTLSSVTATGFNLAFSTGNAPYVYSDGVLTNGNGIGKKFRVQFTLTRNSGTTVDVVMAEASTAAGLTIKASGLNPAYGVATQYIYDFESTYAYTTPRFYFTTTGGAAANFTISNYAVYARGLIISPEQNQLGSGTIWSNTSANDITSITLPSTGFSWCIPFLGRIVSSANLNLLAANNYNINLIPSGTGDVEVWQTTLSASTNYRGLTIRDTIGNRALSLGLASTYNWIQTYTQPLVINLTNNVLIGGTADNGFKFEVTGTSRFNGDSTFNGKINSLDSTVSSAGFNIPHGTAPTSPINGDMWTTTTGLYVRINNATVGPLGTGAGAITSISGTANQVTVSPTTGNVVVSLPTSIINVNSLTAQSGNDFTIIGGSAGATIIAKQGSNGSIFLTPNGSGIINVGGSIYGNIGSTPIDKPFINGFAIWDRPVISVTGASGNGTTVTLTFATQLFPYPIGSTIVVAGMNPAGYNGTYTVQGSTTSSVSYLSSQTGAFVSGGTVEQLFVGIKSNITDTASNANSLLIDLQVGEVSKFKVTKSGALTAVSLAGNGSSITGLTSSQVGLGNVTNDAQTKAAIVPNTLPSAGQILVGNSGGTAYAPVSSSGDVTVASTGAFTIGNSKVTNAMLAGSIDLATKVTGILPIANGGTNASNIADARTNLGLGSAAVLNAGVANGAATLDGSGKLTSTQVPDISVVQYLGAVATQVAMLALTGQQGDWCTRTDLGTNWIITGSNPAQLSSWTQLSYPTSPVTSVFGRTGAVAAVSTDYSSVGITNTAIGVTNPSSGSFITVTSTGASGTSGALFLKAFNTSSGSVQHWAELQANNGLTLVRFLRGNGAAGYDGNGLNVESYEGFNIYLNSLGGANGKFVVSGGDVSFETSSTLRELKVTNANGSARVVASGAAAYIGGFTGMATIIQSGGANSIVINSANSTLYTVSALNVGIGNTSPSEALDIGTNSAGKNVKINSTLGSELIPALTAGNWTGTNWSATGTTITHTTGTTGSISPTSALSISAGKVYKVVMTLTAGGGGYVNFSLGGKSYNISTAATQTWYVYAINTNNLSIGNLSNGDATTTISSVSIKEVVASTGMLTVEGPVTFNSTLAINNLGIGTPSSWTINAPLEVIDYGANAIRVTRQGVPNQYLAIHTGGGGQFTIGAYAFGNDKAFVISTDATNQGIQFHTGLTPSQKFEIAGSGKIFTSPSAYSVASWTTAGSLFEFRSTTVTNSSTAASTTAASAVFYSFAAPTLAATNASVTTTAAAAVYIAGDVVAGANQTLTNSYGLWNVGKTRLDGNVGIGLATASTKLHVAGSSILANNTSIDPDDYTSTIVAGNISDGSGWGALGIGGNNGTGDSWGIGHNGTALYIAMGNGSANNTLQTYIQLATDRNLYLNPTSGSVAVGTTSVGSNVFTGTFKLDVDGSSRIANSITASAFGVIKTSSATSTAGLILETGGSSDPVLFATGGSYSGSGIKTASTLYLGAYNLNTAIASENPNGYIAFASGGTAEKMRLSSLGYLGVNNNAPSTRLTVGTKVVDDFSYSYDINALYAVHQTATSTTVLNDPQEILLLARQGTAAQAYGAAASFRLSRYENSGLNSRTRLDLVLAHGSFLSSPTTVMTVRSDGNIGIGTTVIDSRLTLKSAGDYATFYNDSDVKRLTITNAGELSFNTSASLGLVWGTASLRFAGQFEGVQIIPFSTTYVGLSIKGNVSQTESLQYWKDSAGTVLSRVNADGAIQIGAKIGSGSNVYSFSGYKFGIESGSARIIGPELTAQDQTSNALDILLGSNAAWGNLTSRITFTARDRGNNVDAGTIAFIGVNKTSSMNVIGSGELIFGTAAALSSTSTERMRIDKDGNIGIGIASPATKLDIRAANTSFATATLRIGTQTHGSSGDSFANMEFYWGDPDSSHISSKIYAINTGNVGPGGGGAADIRIATAVSSITPTLVDRLTIKNDGNVGIGISIPEAKLDVAGTIAGTNLYGQIGHSTGGKVRFWADSAGQNFISNYWVTYDNTDARWEWNATTTVGAVKLDFPNSGVFTVNVKSSAAITAGNPVSFVSALTVSETTTTVAGNLTVNSGANFSGRIVMPAASSSAGLKITSGFITSPVVGDAGVIEYDGAGGVMNFINDSGLRRRIFSQGSPIDGSNIGDTTPASGTFNTFVVMAGYNAIFNGNIIAKNSINLNGAVTAVLYLPGGSTTKVPIFLTSGTLATTAVAHGVEWDGTNLYITNASAVRKTVAYTDSNISGQAGSVANSVTFNNTNSGAASGTAYNGSAAVTVSANTVGALSLNGGTVSGNVGIGIAPTQKLQVDGPVGNPATTGTTQNGIFRISNATDNAVLDIGIRAGGAGAWIQSTDETSLAANYTLLLNPNGGNVAIGALSTSYKLEVNGSFAATTKSFVIPHPTKEGKKLRYGSLEGPENGVYIRGKTTSKVIELPDYWTKLVDPDSITVQLTPIGSHQKLYVEKIEDNKVYIANENLLMKNINCFFYILAERADVEKLQVEIDA